MTIGNTHKCNLTCQMCFKQVDNANNMTLPDLGLSTFERIGHEVFPHLRTVALSVTGEPFISQSIFDELDLMVSYGVKGRFTTNGMPLSKPGLIDKLMSATDLLTVSFDGATKGTFEAIRRNAKFDRVIANIQSFNAARDALPVDQERPKLQLSHTIQYRSVTELPQLIELAHSLQVDQMSVEHVYIHQQLNRGDSLLKHRRLTNEMLMRARELANKYGITINLPDLFQVDDGEQDDPYVPPALDDLIAHAQAKLDTVKFDPDVHLRNELGPEFAILAEIQEEGRGNREYVERLLERRSLLGHLSWGVPQLGDSLVPTSSEKRTAITVIWTLTHAASRKNFSLSDVRPV